MTAKFFMNGGVNSNWSADTNWSTTSSAGPNNTTHAVAADTVTINAGSPACVVDTASACTSINFTGYTNTYTQNATMTLSSNITFVSGMTIAGTSDLIMTGGGTIATASKTLTFGLQLQGAANTTYTFTGSPTINGALQSNGAGSNIIIGGTSITITLAGGMTVTKEIDGAAGSSVSYSWTGGTWSGSGLFLTQNPTITIAGNVTISGSVVLNGAKLVYSSGTVTTTGSTLTTNGSSTITASAVTFNNVSLTATCTLGADLNMSGTLTWNGAVLTGAHNITCGPWNATLSGTATMVGTITCSGLWTLKWNSTSSFAGGFAITADSAALNSGTGGNGGCTFSADVTITNLTTISGSSTLTGAHNWKTGGLTMSAALPTSTMTVVFNGTGTWSGASTCSLSVTINTAGTLTLSGTLSYGTGTLTYTAGTVSAGSSTLSVDASCTIDTGNMTGSNAWNNVTFNNSGTNTLNSLLTVAATLTLPNSAITFAGSGGFTCATLTTATITAARTHTFHTGNTYTVQTAMNITGLVGNQVTFAGSVASGTKANLTLWPNATQNIGFCSATDIDSSGGQQVVSYKGVLTRATNWTATIPPVRPLFGACQDGVMQA